MKNLVLAVKAEYFHAINDGSKVFEYRLCNAYWAKRLHDCEYGQVIITLGYPKADDLSRRIVRPYRGYHCKTITHPHFGKAPVDVYAIHLTDD